MATQQSIFDTKCELQKIHNELMNLRFGVILEKHHNNGKLREENLQHWKKYADVVNQIHKFTELMLIDVKELSTCEPTVNP